ncbi:MAG: S8 family serine peptidase [Solirubrobacterales bacterium]
MITRNSTVGQAVALGLLAAAGFCLTGASTVTAREARTGPAAELASQLLPIRGGNDMAIDQARQVDLTISRAERVLVQVYVTGDAESAGQRLRDAGMSVKATAEEPLPVVEGWIKADDLTSVATLGVSAAITPVIGGGSDVGAATSEGVAAHRIPEALTAGSSNGAGVDVGVVSSSINQLGGGISDSQATGDLPATVTVLKDDPAATDDEGRAMAEIIYDGASGIDSILYASGTTAGPAGKADSIDLLVANGADVIADDIFFLNEPFFQDGVIAQAVDRARAAGVTYIASAGNRARQSWEGAYEGSAGDQGIHDFDSGPGEDRVQTLTTIGDGGYVQLAFQWDEAWGPTANDMDIQLVKADGSQLPCAVPNQNPSGGTNDNTLEDGGVPLEIVTWANDCAAGNIEVGLRITRFSGALNPFMKYIIRGSFGNFNPEFSTGSNAINPDAASARGALAVAAVNVLDPGLDTPAPYSSRGPNTRLFDKDGVRLASPEVRLKPELAATDGLITTVPGFGPDDTPFFGTSAAVPSAASIAAILRSSHPTASAGKIEEAMVDPANAIDCTESALVPDPDCGAGFLLADRAFRSIDMTPPDTTINSGPSGTITTGEATFSFAGNPAGDTAKVQCRLDTGLFADCVSPMTFAGLTDGSHTVEFRAEDAAGNQDPTPAARTFSVDTTVYRAKIGKVTVAGPARAKKGKKVTYRVKIKNSGNADATGVEIKVSGKGVKAKKSAGKVTAGRAKTAKLKLKLKKPGKTKISFKVTSTNAGTKSLKKKVNVRK